jgi:hypothetical protein
MDSNLCICIGLQPVFFNRTPTCVFALESNLCNCIGLQHVYLNWIPTCVFALDSNLIFLQILNETAWFKIRTVWSRIHGVIKDIQVLYSL